MTVSSPASRNASATLTASANPPGIWRVIAASSAGTVIEWYDFFLFGSLAAVLSGVFYPSQSATVSLLKWLATYAAGFAVRPLGALVFGRIGDVVGRKVAFLSTLLIMGSSTAIIGLLPGYGTLGFMAPVILVTLRLLQGLALGGEYGGAAVYVAEHAPDHRRGFFTSFIQATATLGLFLSIVVILVTRGLTGERAFAEWGWRIPFLLSALMVVLSYYIRMRLAESPVFAQMKAEGTSSRAPISESFGSWAGWRTFLIVLFAVTGAQSVIFYTGQFYVLLFLQTVLKVPIGQAYAIVAVALALATPLFLVTGALSDRIGRKRVMMAANVFAALLYIPIYHAMSAAAGPVDPTTQTALQANVPLLTALVFVQVVLVAVAYGPVAAFLVESYPARIRYTAMSLPYHFGAGWFGGFLPLIATALVARTGNRYAGLYYPIAVTTFAFILSAVALKETRENSVWS